MKMRQRVSGIVLFSMKVFNENERVMFYRQVAEMPTVLSDMMFMKVWRA